MNYFEMHVGDYESATAHLSIVEDGIYSRLMRVYYRTERPIPADMNAACRLVRAASKQERSTVAAVLAEFFVLADDGWHNARCDEEIARFHDKQTKARASADARWNAHRAQCERNANASPEHMRTHNGRNANGMPRAPVPSTQYPNQIPSEPNGSGASAPPSDRDLVFANGISLLTAAGVKEANARSFLAAQSKAHGDRAVRDALERCAEERPIQPVPWLQATLGNGKAKASKHAGFATKDYTAGVTHDGFIA